MTPNKSAINIKHEQLVEIGRAVFINTHMGDGDSFLCAGTWISNHDVVKWLNLTGIRHRYDVMKYDNDIGLILIFTNKDDCSLFKIAFGMY